MKRPRLFEGMRIKLKRGTESGPSALWCAGRVPAGEKGTVYLDGDTWCVKWDRPHRISEKNDRYVFGLIHVTSGYLPEDYEVLPLDEGGEK